MPLPAVVLLAILFSKGDFPLFKMSFLTVCLLRRISVSVWCLASLSLIPWGRDGLTKASGDIHYLAGL